jgi:hypothetical protein
MMVQLWKLPMIQLTRSTRLSIALALVVTSSAALWLIAVPDTITWSTFAMFVALLTALTAVTVKTYTNGRATGSVGQLLHETDIAPATTVRGRGATNSPRPQA